jgi:myo-inositol-1(or 4)-monophosphatase
MSICNEIVSAVRGRLHEILSLRGDFVSKADGSFVSQGDLLVQSIVIGLLTVKMPSYILISEELAPFSEVCWDPDGNYIVLDPIDGTENFVSGLKEWGVGVSVFSKGKHLESCIFLPELDECLISKMLIRKFTSRIIGLSSSLNKHDLMRLPESDFEYRIIGCSMYNTLSAIKGSFAFFENVKGVNCWDILPGLNLALEHGCQVFVDELPYTGQILFPTKKYKIKISNVGGA